MSKETKELIDQMYGGLNTISRGLEILKKLPPDHPEVKKMMAYGEELMKECLGIIDKLQEEVDAD